MVFVQSNASSSKASSSKATALESAFASDSESENAAASNPTTPLSAKTQTSASKVTAVNPVKVEGNAKSTKHGTVSRKRAHSVTMVSSGSPSGIHTPDITKRTRFESDSSLEVSEITPAAATKRKPAARKGSTTNTAVDADKIIKSLKGKRRAKPKAQYTSAEFITGSDEEGEEEKDKDEVATVPQSTSAHSL